MASAPFLAVRRKPSFGRRLMPVVPGADPAGMLFFARCWLAATAFILIWVG